MIACGLPPSPGAECRDAIPNLGLSRAALHGHANLAMLLFLQGGVTELSCPVCGEYIVYGENEG